MDVKTGDTVTVTIRGRAELRSGGFTKIRDSLGDAHWIVLNNANQGLGPVTSVTSEPPKPEVGSRYYNSQGALFAYLPDKNLAHPWTCLESGEYGRWRPGWEYSNASQHMTPEKEGRPSPEPKPAYLVQGGLYRNVQGVLFTYLPEDQNPPVPPWVSLTSSQGLYRVGKRYSMESSLMKRVLAE